MSELQIRKATRKEPTVLAVQLTEENYRYVAAWLNEQIEEIQRRYDSCIGKQCEVNNGEGLALLDYFESEFGRFGDWAVVEQNAARFVPDEEFNAIYALEPTNART